MLEVTRPVRHNSRLHLVQREGRAVHRAIHAYAHDVRRLKGHGVDLGREELTRYVHVHVGDGVGAGHHGSSRVAGDHARASREAAACCYGALLVLHHVLPVCLLERAEEGHVVTLEDLVHGLHLCGIAGRGHELGETEVVADNDPAALLRDLDAQDAAQMKIWRETKKIWRYVLQHRLRAGG